MPANAFGYVPTPALVAPIEFTLRRADYAALGGHCDHPSARVVAPTTPSTRPMRSSLAARVKQLRPTRLLPGWRATAPGARSDRPGGRGVGPGDGASAPPSRLDRPEQPCSVASAEVLVEAPVLPLVPVPQAACRRRSPAAMVPAVAPFAVDHFITPMAAVAGSVAEEILGSMLARRNSAAPTSIMAATSRCICWPRTIHRRPVGSARRHGRCQRR